MGTSAPGSITWPPVPPVPPSLVASFEAFTGKRASELTPNERLDCARLYVAASFGVDNGMQIGGDL